MKNTYKIQKVLTSKLSRKFFKAKNSSPSKYMYTVGNAMLLSNKSTKIITVVGSRLCSQYGQDIVKHLIESLQPYNVAIVSGLALGIDTLVHQECLTNNIPCIAVPGSGLNREVLYPRTNQNLAEQIVNKGGLLVSEYEPDFRASPWSFPMRNRIMAGLADAVILIEGEKDSGTMITARLAPAHAKVYAIPGSIFSETSKGCNELIRQNKATLLTSPQDIIDDLKLILKRK